MAVVLEERHELLRLGVAGGPVAIVGPAAGDGRQVWRRPGVIDFEDVPAGANVTVRVDRPHHLSEEAERLSPVEVVATVGRTLTFAAGPPGTITASSGSFIADGYRVGMGVIVVSGLNAGRYIIEDVTATVITVAPALVLEGPVSAGETLNGTPTLAQPYRFELAPFPTLATLPGVPAAAAPRTLKRVLIAPSAGPGGSGPVAHHQMAPVFVASPVAGALFQSGKAPPAIIAMPGQAGSTPNLAPQDRRILRLRWTGTPVAGATLDTLAAPVSSHENHLWANAHTGIVPGSIRITLPSSGLFLRDDGKGRLLTEDGQSTFAGDGAVDYQTGAYWLTFGAPETGGLLVDYEHGCPFLPLDAHLAWDALMQ